GVVVFGYAGDGEGFLDRWVMNRWLASQGSGIVMGDYALRDPTLRPAGALESQPYAEPAEGTGLRDPGVAPFPFGRNHGLLVSRQEQVLARTSAAAFVYPPGQPAAARRGAAVAAASRVGDGLVLVASRHARGALAPLGRPALPAPGEPRRRATPPPPLPWAPRQPLRALWAPRPLRPGPFAAPRRASLDSLLAFLDVGGFNTLIGDAAAWAAD